MRRLVIATLIIVSFCMGYGAVTNAWPWYGRNKWYGYFFNILDTFGSSVLPPIYDGGANAIPNYIDNANELIAFIENNYYNGNTQQRIGAGFIMDTMIGGDHGWGLTGADILSWETDVQYAAANGRINWWYGFAHSINSYWQGAPSGSNPSDDAFYDHVGTSTTIIFVNGSGTITYGIRRQCANPVGNGNFNPIESHDYNMVADTDLSNATPYAGDTITFTHWIRNAGPDSSTPYGISWRAEYSNGSLINSGSPGIMGASGSWSLVYTHNYPIPINTPAGTQICERTGVYPADEITYSWEYGANECATVRAAFSLSPTVNLTVNGAASPGGVAEVGDQLVFTFAVNNGGPGASPSANCTVYGLTRNGYYSPPTPADNVSDPGYVPPVTGCPRVFPLGNTTLTTQTIASVAATDLNRSICRSLYVNPSSPTVANASNEVCAKIVAKPYTRVYGGDVSAGNALDTGGGVCPDNDEAAVVSWNRGAGQSYAGAGAQFAVLALDQIYAFTSSQGYVGTVGPPNGLVFANSTAPSGDNYGGTYGDMTCIQNYYNMKPGVTSPLASPLDVGTLASGNYNYTGDLTLRSASVAASRRVSIFVDGNVIIDNGAAGSITYAGSWSTASMPFLRIVARGNIYIDNDISRIDGLYVAQRNGAAGGVVYTCTSGITPVAPTSVGFHASCDNTKLTVNGSLIGYQMQLGRTFGTLSRSTSGETAAAGFAAEVVNYGPIMWIPQPAPASGVAPYDAVTSLPPIL